MLIPLNHKFFQLIQNQMTVDTKSAATATVVVVVVVVAATAAAITVILTIQYDGGIEIRFHVFLKKKRERFSDEPFLFLCRVN